LITVGDRMDITIPIILALKKAWFLIPIFILLVIMKTPWFKGLIGETLVNLGAKMFLNKDEYHLVKNVILPTADGTTQVDHIIVSRYGLFVIETKNMKGWIFGSPNQKTWTQKIYRHTNTFQNPLHQNYKHVKTLESALGIDGSKIHSVVVFIGDSTFKTEMPDNVTSAGGYIRFIKSKKEILFSDVEVRAIRDKIASGRLTPSFKANREHVKHVKDIVSAKQNAEICAKCGSPLVLREIKKGPNEGKKFLGCSKFPQCRFVVNVKETGSDPA
jgi:restriction system protein